MSSSESPLNKSTDTLSNDTQVTPDMQGAKKWESAMRTVASLVSEFLATRADTTPRSRADVVFERLSVEGSGKGVRSPAMLQTST